VFRNLVIFDGEELLAPRPTPQTGGPPLVVCPRLLIQCIRSYPPYPEAVPPSATRGCAMLWWQGPTFHGERDPLIILQAILPKLCMHFFFALRSARLTHLILLHLITLIIFGEEFKSWSSSLCNFLNSRVSSSLLCPNKFLNICNLCCSFNMRDDVSNPYDIIDCHNNYNSSWNTCEYFIFVLK
jgi:hypothetical protein